MKNYLLTIDRKMLNIIRAIGLEAERQGMAAYVVGGIVRDIMIGRKNLDLDIVVEGDAVLMAEALAGRRKRSATIHRRFGTASFEMPDGSRFDFATARKETYAHPGALPTVQRGGLEDDLFRRDFTINAMAIAINSGRFGQLRDPFGGWKDLSEGTIRILHERSFIDDPTRILRAVRFEQRFGFRIERKTFLLMKEALARKALATIKPARYFSELKKILSEPEPFRYLKRLHDLGALDFVDPQLEVDFPNFRRFCRHIQQLRRRILYKNADFRLVYFVGMMAGSPKSGIGRVLSKFPWTRMERESIRQSLKREVLLKDLSAEKISASGVYRLLRPLTMETVLYLRVYARRPKVVRRIDRFLAKDKEVKLAIGGEDLKRLGMVSGEQMGKILGEVLSLKVDRCVRTKQQELRAARCLYHQVMKQRDQSRS